MNWRRGRLSKSNVRTWHSRRSGHRCNPRVNYNPWLSLYWLVAGKTMGGATLYSEANRLGREEALKLHKQGNNWFSGESGKIGGHPQRTIRGSHRAHRRLFLHTARGSIKGIESVLTIVGGKIVYSAQEFQDLDPTPYLYYRIGRPLRFMADLGRP
jgi:hypothetical protein